MGRLVLRNFFHVERLSAAPTVDAYGGCGRRRTKGGRKYTKESLSLVSSCKLLLDKLGVSMVNECVGVVVGVWEVLKGTRRWFYHQSYLAIEACKGVVSMME